jgi:hypothetical protein
MHDLPEPAQDASQSALAEEEDSDKKLRFIRRRPNRNSLEAAE